MNAIQLRAISLFSNCGAGDIGYAKAGFKFDVMAELDPRRLDVCLLNHPGAVGVVGDLRKTWPNVVDEYLSVAKGEKLSLLCACPPCQGMSSARSDRGNENDPDAGMKDSRNLLVTVISKVAKELKPTAIVVENVQAFLTRQVRHPRTNVPISAARLLVDELSQEYTAYPFLTDLSDYGVPQRRIRTFLTFFRNDSSIVDFLNTKDCIPYPIPRHAPDGKGPITLRQALQSFGLPPLDAKSESKAITPIAQGLHSVPVWDERQYAMVAAIPKHTGKSAWQNDRCKNCRTNAILRDKAHCPQCGEPLLRPIVKLRGAKYRLVTGFKSSTYSRMKSDSPAAAITTASGHVGSNHTIHPFENRVLSPLECALLQTLPKNFKWGKAIDIGHTCIRHMIGEAVPPKFTRLHGNVLKSLFDGKTRLRVCKTSDKRSLRAVKALGLVEAKAQAASAK